MTLMLASEKNGRVLPRTGPLVGSNHKTAAQWNRALVLRLVRQRKTLSRRQISQITGLRGSTLTYIVRELLEKRVLRTVGKASSKAVGQKQVLLDANPDLGYFLGFSLRPAEAKLVVIDAAGGRLGGTQFPVSGALREMPGQLRPAVQRWLDELPSKPSGRLLGVGAGVTGVVNHSNGVVLHSALFGADEVPLLSLLNEQFPDATIQVDHDACFGALAEGVIGMARSTSNFIYFSINHNRQDQLIRLNSFGSALFLDGRAYRGAHFAAGEFDTCLSPRRDLIAAEEDLAALASEETPLSQTLQVLAQAVGTTLAALINFLDVEMVVLGGNCNIINKSFLAGVREQTESLLIAVPGRTVRVVGSQIRGEAVAFGAAIAASDAALENGSILSESMTVG